MNINHLSDFASQTLTVEQQFALRQHSDTIDKLPEAVLRDHAKLLVRVLLIREHFYKQLLYGDVD